MRVEEEKRKEVACRNHDRFNYICLLLVVGIVSSILDGISIFITDMVET